MQVVLGKFLRITRCMSYPFIGKKIIGEVRFKTCVYTLSKARDFNAILAARLSVENANSSCE